MALPAQLQNFIDGPKLPKVILGVAGLVAVVAGAYFLLLSPVMAHITELTQKQAQVTSEMSQVQAQVAEIERFRREVADLEKRLVQLQERLPSEKETPALYRALSTAAEQSGLGVALFQPKTALPRDVVSEIPITISAEGTYHQLAKFFERVAALPRVVTVNDIKMTGLGAKARTSIKADLTLATYMYRGSAPAPAAKPGGPPAPKPAAAAPAGGARS